MKKAVLLLGILLVALAGCEKDDDNEKKPPVPPTSSIVGDWVYDRSADLQGLYELGLYRYSIHEDGTMIESFDSYVRPSTGYVSYVKSYEWREYSDAIYYKYTWEDTEYRWPSYKISDGKLFLMDEFSKTYIPFVKVEDCIEPLMPIYKLSIIPSKSEDELSLQPNESYKLRCEIYATGANYSIDNITLLVTSHNKDTGEVEKEIDLSQYKDKNYCFEIPFTAPSVGTAVYYDLIYDGTYSVPNFRDEVPAEFSHMASTSFGVK